MKRYDLVGVTKCGDAWQEMQEAYLGEWVRWSDLTDEYILTPITAKRDEGSTPPKDS